MNRRMGRGVSVVEVLVALVLLGLAVPMVACFSTTSKKVQVASNEMENATAAAQLVIDSLSLLPAPMIAANSPASVTVEGPFRSYQASWAFSPIGSHAGVVTINVAWSQGGEPHSISVASAVP